MPVSRGELYLYIKRDEDASTVTFHFPVVSKIEDTIRANLTEFSTIVYGSANRFVMDMGTYRTYNITVERVSPVDYNNNSSDSDDWSNGEFDNRLIDAIDFWQNFGYGQDGVWRGGFEAHFISSDEDLYPSFSDNVFLSGTISASRTGPGQKVKYSLPLTVASMQSVSGSSIATVTIYLHSGVDGLADETRTVVRNYATQIPEVPSGWLNANLGMGIKGWDTDSGADDVVYRSGDSITLSEDLHLYAVWAYPVLVEVFDTPVYDVIYGGIWEGWQATGYTIRSVDYTIPTGLNIATCTAIAVGGGGSSGKAGAGVVRYTGGTGLTYSALIYAGGGGGGGGDVATNGFEVFPGQTITVQVGRGSPWYLNEKYHSTPSIVTYNGTQMVYAAGGSNGEDTPNDNLQTPSNLYPNMEVGAGATQYGTGGQAVPYIADDYDADTWLSETRDIFIAESYSSDGVSTDGVTGIPGYGQVGAMEYEDTQYLRIAGGGGAPAAFSVSIQDASGNRYEYTSKGGDGFYTTETDDIHGVYGGGGGGGSRYSLDSDGRQGSDGGDGIVILMFFEE